MPDNPAFVSEPPEAKIARYAKIHRLTDSDVDYILSLLQEARALGSLAGAAAEREACARLAEENCDSWEKEGDGESVIRSQSLYGMADAGREIAAAIRGRKESCPDDYRNSASTSPPAAPM